MFIMGAGKFKNEYESNEIYDKNGSGNLSRKWGSRIRIEKKINRTGVIKTILSEKNTDY
jgi:hypothetical protein